MALLIGIGMSGISRPFLAGAIIPLVSFCCRKKSFWACVRTCVGVRVPTFAMDAEAVEGHIRHWSPHAKVDLERPPYSLHEVDPL